jgi:hypothetical protein
MEFRKHFLKIYTWNMLLYGIELWRITTAEQKRQETVEFWCYRYMMKSNTSLLFNHYAVSLYCALSNSIIHIMLSLCLVQRVTHFYSSCCLFVSFRSHSYIINILSLCHVPWFTLFQSLCCLVVLINELPL